MVLLAATVLPLVFVSSAFSTRPVEPSRHRGVFSFASCAMILLLGIMFAARSSSKIAMLYMMVLCPIIVGIVPTESKFRGMLMHTRLMGLSYAYLARLQGDTSVIKLYIWVEWIFRVIHVHLDTVYVIVNQACLHIFGQCILYQLFTNFNLYSKIDDLYHSLGENLLFFSLSNQAISAKSYNIFVYILDMCLVYFIFFLQVQKWVKLSLIAITAQVLRVIGINWIHTGITSLYLLSMTYHGIPGKDTKIVSWVRSLKLPVIHGLEEYMVPLAIRSVPVILSVVMMLTAVHDSNTWMLCSLVWYTNVFVRVLQTTEWYWSPVAAVRAHRALYPGTTHRQRDWTGPCSICWEDMEQYTAHSTPCGHVFHSNCLMLSMQAAGNTCPLCRYPLPDIGT